MKFCVVVTLSNMSLKALSLVAGCPHASDKRRNPGMAGRGNLVSILTLGVSLIPHFCFAWETFHTSYSMETGLLDTMTCFLRAGAQRFCISFPFLLYRVCRVKLGEVCVCVYMLVYLHRGTYMYTCMKSVFINTNLYVYIHFSHSLCHLEKAFY